MKVPIKVVDAGGFHQGLEIVPDGFFSSQENLLPDRTVVLRLCL